MSAAVPTPFFTHLECSQEGTRYDADKPLGLSDAGAPLLARYDLERVRTQLVPGDLVGRGRDMWRLAELLPIRSDPGAVSLGEAITPLVPLRQPARLHGAGDVVVKDEGRLPTYSFKARGLAMAVAKAREFGITSVAMPTNGNAGAALAAYATRAGIDSHIFCPADTPEVNVREIALHGGNVWRVDGLIDDCGALVTAGVDEIGWFDMSTLKEPYRLEGKKTMGFDLAEQYGWELPDVIFYPTGGGTGLIGMWKAFAELTEIGWLRGELPRMVAVQAAGCAPIVRAFERGDAVAERWQNAATVAAGIRVPVAIGDRLILQAVRDSNGFAIAVDDDAITAAQQRIASEEGLLTSPEGAATYAGYETALERGLVTSRDRVVLFNCGNGLKYPMPDAGELIDHRDPPWDRIAAT